MVLYTNNSTNNNILSRSNTIIRVLSVKDRFLKLYHFFYLNTYTFRQRDLCPAVDSWFVDYIEATCYRRQSQLSKPTECAQVQSLVLYEEDELT